MPDSVYNRDYKGHMFIKEVQTMPARDGTGPMGVGAMTGGGFGFRMDGNDSGLNQGMGWRRGRGCGRGFGRGFAAGGPMDGAARELLIRQKAALEDRLKRVNEQLERQ